MGGGESRGCEIAEGVRWQEVWWRQDRQVAPMGKTTGELF